MKQRWGVVFDLDGVIVDSATHWKRVDNTFLQGLVAEWSPERQRAIFGMSIFQIYDLLAAEHAVSMTREAFLDYYRDLAATIYHTQAELLPGAFSLIEKLHHQGAPLAVASSSATEWIELVLNRFSLRPFFQGWVGADRVNGEGKPSPRVYLEALKLLDLAPHCAVAIEDSSSGIESARAAGMRVIAVHNDHNTPTDLVHAHLSVTALNDLTPALIHSLLPTG